MLLNYPQFIVEKYLASETYLAVHLDQKGGSRAWEKRRRDEVLCMWIRWCGGKTERSKRRERLKEKE